MLIGMPLINDLKVRYNQKICLFLIKTIYELDYYIFFVFKIFKILINFKILIYIINNFGKKIFLIKPEKIHSVETGSNIFVFYTLSKNIYKIYYT